MAVARAVEPSSDSRKISTTAFAVTRLVGAMLLEQSDEWTLQRRYMQLEGLQSLSDTAPSRLPAVAR